MSKEQALEPFKRLDQVLVERGHFQSRSRAADAVLRKAVTINGNRAEKPSQKIAPDWQISVDDPARKYVSRAALKLKAGLEIFGYDPQSRIALDLGASTGGFTQLLLERGAHHVFAVDVGHDQLHPDLRQRANITHHEGLNIRALTGDHLVHDGKPASVNALVCDVSFISLKLALPPVFSFLQPKSWVILLVKPQFEVGRKAIGKGGIVRNPEDALKAAEEIAIFLKDGPGWQINGIVPCPVRGSDGNQEYLLGAITL